MEKTIEVDIRKKEDLYEKYNQKIVSRELINYLILNTPIIKKQDTIKIIINNETKESDIAILIKEGLKKEYNDSINRRNRNNVLQALYFFIGLIGLYISTLITNVVFKEVVLIGGWVFIWALVEMELFLDGKGRIKRKVLQKLLLSEFIEK